MAKTASFGVEDQVRVVSSNSGETVDLGRGSFTRFVLSKPLSGTEKSCMGISRFRPGINTPQKIHDDGEELCYVVEGHGKITTGRSEVSFSPKDAIFIPTRVPHGIKNDGEEDVVMVFFFSTPEYPKTRNA
jgi:quercetin dioxygenase-like cupin family protein